MRHRSVLRFRWIATWRVLLAVDAELRRNPGVSLAEASMHFERAAAGLRLHARQRHRSDALPIAARDSRRSATRTARSRSARIPNSFGGQYQLKGYELVDELRPAGERSAHRRRGGGAALRRSVSGGRIRPDPGQLATRPADSRIDRPSHRTGSRAGQRGQLRGHELPHAGPAEPACATDRKSSTWCATRARSTVRASARSPSTTRACRRRAPTSSATASSSAT